MNHTQKVPTKLVSRALLIASAMTLAFAANVIVPAPHAHAGWTGGTGGTKTPCPKTSTIKGEKPKTPCTR